MKIFNFLRRRARNRAFLLNVDDLAEIRHLTNQITYLNIILHSSNLLLISREMHGYLGRCEEDFLLCSSEWKWLHNAIITATAARKEMLIAELRTKYAVNYK